MQWFMVGIVVVLIVAVVVLVDDRRRDANHVKIARASVKGMHDAWVAESKRFDAMLQESAAARREQMALLTRIADTSRASMAARFAAGERKDDQRARDAMLAANRAHKEACRAVEQHVYPMRPPLSSRPSAVVVSIKKEVANG